MRTLVLTLALLFATSAYAEDRSLSGSEKPAEAAQSDAKASDAKSEAKSEAKFDEKKKPVAKKRETDEEKARRIAKRYGVTW